MPSLQEVEQFKSILNELGDEPEILAERDEEIEDVPPPEQGLPEGLSELLETPEGPPAEAGAEGAAEEQAAPFPAEYIKEFEQVVAVSIGNQGMKVIGFVTQAVSARLPEGLQDEESILVYLPLSYMIGGYTVLLPRSAVQPLDMSMEEAMRFTLTAGVTGASTVA